MSGTHFNWRMSLVTMKMRVGLVTAIYNKSLAVRQLDSAGPDILNLMSTDTDRIVNSCISFHSFWSIPFQVRLSKNTYFQFAICNTIFVFFVSYLSLYICSTRKSVPDSLPAFALPWR